MWKHLKHTMLHITLIQSSINKTLIQYGFYESYLVRSLNWPHRECLWLCVPHSLTVNQDHSLWVTFHFQIRPTMDRFVHQDDRITKDDLIMLLLDYDLEKTIIREHERKQITEAGEDGLNLTRRVTWWHNFSSSVGSTTNRLLKCGMKPIVCPSDACASLWIWCYGHHELQKKRVNGFLRQTQLTSAGDDSGPG